MGSFWLGAHRPFFVLSALWALLAGLGWLAGLREIGGADYGNLAALHAPLLILGFGGAASAGFLLTSLPGWTKGAPVQGGVLVALVLAWLLGQAVIARQVGLGAGAGLPGLLAVALFPLGLAAVMAWAIVVGRAWRRLFALAVPGGLGGVALAYVGWPQGVAAALAAHPSAPVLLYVMLISVVGGRAIIGFGRNFLARSGRAAVKVAAGWEEPLALAVLAGGMAVYLASDGGAGALGLGLAAGSQLFRLRRWLASPIWREPLVAVLLAGFLWLPAGLVALALARLQVGPLASADALHALSMGMMGGMIAAMAGRAAARRVNGALVARRGLIVACTLIWLAAVVRLTAALWPSGALAGMEIAAVLWLAGWGGWLLAYAPALRGPVLRPVLSGRRATPAAPGNR